LDYSNLLLNSRNEKNQQSINKLKGKAFILIGYINENQSNYVEALKNYQYSLKIFEAINDRKAIAYCHYCMGNIYENQGNYPEAFKNYFSSLKISEEIKDKKNIERTYNGIGLIYQAQGNYPEALKNYIISLKLCQEINNSKGISSCYNNIGNIYFVLGNYKEASVNLTSSLRMSEAMNDKSGVEYAYGNLGNLYAAQNNYSKALTNYFACMKISEEIGDQESSAGNYCNIGFIYMKQKKYAEAFQFLEKSKDISKKIGAKDFLKNTLDVLTQLDSSTGNYRAAYENYKLYILYRDSLDNEETRKKTIQSQMTYEFDKKEAIAEAEHKSEMEKQNAIAEEKSRKQKVVILFVAVGLLLVIGFAGFIFRSLRITRKQKHIIEEQKDVVEKHKEIIEEKHKEITDSINYAERIQRSFLASKTLLDENLKDYFVFFQPKDVVSGDFYFASKLENKNFTLVCADSTGHGVPGAIMSILNISCLEKSIEEKQLVEPAEILNYTRTQIIERLKKDGSEEGGKDGMDCSLISFDFKNNKLIYAAANNPIWIVRGKNLIEFLPDKMPVGKHERDTVSFTQHTIDLQTDDIVYALTDGMADQFGGVKGKKFMYKRLKELLVSIVHLSMDEQKKNLQNTLNNWKGDLEQVDDVCIIGVRI
jgi:serine phosphatase RsbU (regulator of sigma subunit)